ncbi:MAG: AbrB/MazE/SpoVT family DNA-binding domain-containing protein [Spirochaetaceae bacterium]|nr:MAG: AbrB/MazE/SpoVT family DNA-binding domain-containing protein [Spirochaetaceae bacterium]
MSEKGQITIPRAVRDKLGIVPGTVLEVDSSEGEHSGVSFRIS